MENKKLIAIVGTNASGKSSIGLNLAQKFDGEIISADSRQIFCGFDLCSGKVSDEEAQIIPHHLIDIRNIGEPFSVSDFQDLAYMLIPQIQSRNKIPFIVGGTGLYVSSVVHGYTLNAEPIDQQRRVELEKMSLEELWKLLTPEGKSYLESKPSDALNKRRIIRVIEKTSNGDSLAHENIPQYDTLQLGVTWSKEILHERIMERLVLRIEQGMINEVKRYLDDGGNPDYLFNLGLEYRHILWYLTGKYRTLDEFVVEMARAIRHFAKKQMTWFRRDKSIVWLEMTSNPEEQASELIYDFMQR